MKLYFNPLTRSTRPRWMLEELGVPYEISPVDVMKGEQKLPAYMEKAHPLGGVDPVTESGQLQVSSKPITRQRAHGWE